MVAESKLLFDSVASTLKDYRSGDLPAPTPDHVERWIRQFDPENQLSLLREIDYVMKKSYFSRSKVDGFFKRLITHKNLVGSDPCSFWHSAQILDVQRQGNSQSEIRNVFSSDLESVCGLSVEDCGLNSEPIVHVYLDDVLFSGDRIVADLTNWISLQSSTTLFVHVVVIASHKYGEWRCNTRLVEGAREAGKQLKIRIWAAVRVENRKTYRNTSDVLWPATLPDNPELTAYMETEERYPFVPRNLGGRSELNLFSSETGRQALEREMLLAGMRIRSFCHEPSPVMRPLGRGSFGLGFGSMITTYRNCPNTVPLALWWGDPNAYPGHPFSKWYPLLPRRTYGTLEE